MIVTKKPTQILLVEDNPADVDLTREVLAEKNHIHLNAVSNGELALSFLHRRGSFSGVPRPDVIILDLNLPGIDGRRILQELMIHRDLSRIPVIVFSSSQALDDVLSSYRLGANCYFRKPGNLPEFKAVVKAMADFWVPFASQPQRAAVDKGTGSPEVRAH